VIVLSNGDKWILDDSEWESANISYEDATACKLPVMPIREFIERIAAASEPDGEHLLPRKWTNAFDEGYWDANFNVYEEVFVSAASQIITNPWSKVYIMPWGHVYAVYQMVDSGGYDAYTEVTKLESFEEYKEMVLK